jgi:hypothetical protein
MLRGLCALTWLGMLVLCKYCFNVITEWECVDVNVGRYSGLDFASQSMNSLV